MFIRSRQEALDAVAEILDLPDRSGQIVQCTVKVALCLEWEQRDFLADCQALLIEGGLDSLRRKRRDSHDSWARVPLVVLDPENDRLFEALATAMDALKLTEVVRQVFPDARFERWQAARALMVDEAEVRALVTRAIRGRGDARELRLAQEALDARLRQHRPIWADRAGAIRIACLQALQGQADPASIHAEADDLFELFATTDGRAMHLLAALDSDSAEAVRQIRQVRELAVTVRSLRAEQPA